jgi:hypothetical protein
MPSASHALFRFRGIGSRFDGSSDWLRRPWLAGTLCSHLTQCLCNASLRRLPVHLLACSGTYSTDEGHSAGQVGPCSALPPTNIRERAGDGTRWSPGAR